MYKIQNSYIANKTGALKIATETSCIAVTIGHTTSEVTVADNLTVTGDLTVSGTTTTVNSTTVNLLSQFLDQVEFYDPDILSDGSQDPISLTWADNEGNSLSPLQTVTVGDYIYIFFYIFFDSCRIPGFFIS